MPLSKHAGCWENTSSVGGNTRRSRVISQRYAEPVLLASQVFRLNWLAKIVKVKLGHESGSVRLPSYWLELWLLTAPYQPSGGRIDSVPLSNLKKEIATTSPKWTLDNKISFWSNADVFFSILVSEMCNMLFLRVLHFSATKE